MAEAVAQPSRQVDESPGTAGFAVSAFTVCAVALTLVALVMRLAGINGESLWLDEGYTLLFSGMPLPRLLTVGGAHEHPPLYYLLVHALSGIWHSYLIPRGISAVAGSLSVLTVAVLGKRLLSAGAGLIAAALVTVSPFHLWYSQDGRAYALAGLFVLLSYLCLVVASTEGGWRRWVLYALCTLLSLYTDYTTVLALLPQALFLLRSRRGLLLSWAGVAAGFVPWLGVLLHDTASVAGDYWIPPPTSGSVTTTAREFLGIVTPCPSPPCTGQELPALAGSGTLLAWIAIAAVAVTAAWAIRSRRFEIGLLAAWLLVPFLVVLALVPLRSLYLDRVFLDATFPLFLLIGAGVTAAWASRGARSAGLVLLALLLVANVATTSLVYANRTNPDWPSLARDLHAAYRAPQALMFNPGVLRPLVDAYLPSGWHATRQRALWSRSYLDVPGWQRYYPDARKTDPASRSRIEAILRDRQLADVTRGGLATWLVTFDYSGLNDTRRWFTVHGYQPLVSQLYPGDTRLELWSRKGPSSLGRAVIHGPLGSRWKRQGSVTVSSGTAMESGKASMSTSFSVRAGRAYSVALQYLAMPGASPHAEATVYDANGRLLETFPHTMWYELPDSGVWLAQPFGFIPPPGAVRATLTLRTGSGLVRWRDVGVFTTR